MGDEAKMPAHTQVGQSITHKQHMHKDIVERMDMLNVYAPILIQEPGPLNIETPMHLTK